MSGVLDRVSQEALDRILAAARRRSFGSGEVIVRQGEPAHAVHFVTAGRVGLTVSSPSGERAALALLGPGDSFAEEAVLSQAGSYSSTAAALEATEVLVLRRTDFDRIRALHSDLATQLMATLVERVDQLADKLIGALYVPADQKVLRAVADLSREYGKGGVRAEIPLSQQEVAAFAGVARATANRVLRQAARDGLVALGRSRVKILDPSRLALRAGLDAQRSHAGTRSVVRPAGARPPVPRQERKLVTVLQAELKGLAGVADPEQAQTLATAFHLAVRQEIAREGGVSDRHVGGTVMAFFGAPRTRIDDSVRAVRAATRITQLTLRLKQELGARGLSIRVGVEAGPALVPAAGRTASDSPAISGAVLTAAAELLAAAPPGQVLVGPEAYAASRRLISYQKTSAGAWLATAEPTPEGLILDSPMVGRDLELGFLESIWLRVVREQRPHLVTLVGAPGIGKTRVALQLAVMAESDGGRVLRGRSLPSGGSLGYAAFAQQVKALAGVSDSDSGVTAREKILHMTSEALAVANSEETADHIGLLLGLGDDEPPADRSPLFQAARRLLEGEAKRQALLLVFEDLHWSDPALLDLLESLAGRCREVPLLFVGLTRPELMEMRPNWGASVVNHTQLELMPLSQAASKSLALALLHPVDPGAGGVDRLVERSEGNPLFIEELVGALREEGESAGEKLPATVTAAIAARIDALPTQARALLLDASVFGNIFWAGALRGLAHRTALAAELDTLEARGLVRREHVSRFANDEELSFKHTLIREVAYAILPRAARQERHLAAARFLERVAGDRAVEWASTLAHHYREGGQPQRAVGYLVVAAEEAAKGWAKNEAVGLLGQALELVPDGGARRREIELRRSIALVAVGDYSSAVPELKVLLPELEGRARADALLALAESTMWMDEEEGPHVYARQAEALARELGDQDLRAASLARLSHGLSMVGETTVSLAQGEEAITSWRPGARQAELAYHLEMTGLCYYWTDRYDRAIDLLHRAYALGLEVHSVRDLLRAGGTLGMTLAAAGRNEEAQQMFTEVVGKGRELEQLPRWTSRALNMWAGALRDMLDIPAARRLNEEALDLARSASFSVSQLQSRIDLLFCDLAEGEPGRALSAWPELQEMSDRTIGHHRWLMGGRLAEARSEIDLQLGRPADAIVGAQRAIGVAAQTQRKRYEVAARIVLGRALLELNRREEGLSELRRALRDARRIKNPHAMWRAGVALAMGLEKAGDETAAQTARSSAERVATRIGLQDKLRPV